MLVNKHTTTHEVVEHCILPQLNKVHSTGTNAWRACCPAHKGNNQQTFKISLAEDGRILFHCFAGCSAHEICEALYIEITDLFPADGHHMPVRKSANIPTENSFYVAACEAKIRRGERLTVDEKTQYMQRALSEKSRLKRG